MEKRDLKPTVDHSIRPFSLSSSSFLTLSSPFHYLFPFLLGSPFFFLPFPFYHLFSSLSDSHLDFTSISFLSFLDYLIPLLSPPYHSALLPSDTHFVFFFFTLFSFSFFFLPLFLFFFGESIHPFRSLVHSLHASLPPPPFLNSLSPPSYPCRERRSQPAEFACLPSLSLSLPPPSSHLPFPDLFSPSRSVHNPIPILSAQH